MMTMLCRFKIEKKCTVIQFQHFSISDTIFADTDYCLTVVETSMVYVSILRGTDMEIEGQIT
jgi:hypothetical protein